MELASKYDPKLVEDKWYQYWLSNKYFHSEPDHRKAFTIVIPPPNVTGVLHMGHILNNTIQDVLTRRARMQGFNACWLPGTDHASIATEAKVVNKLKNEGIQKNDLSRDEFLKHAWEWTEKHGGIILDQLKKLGASCDWDRTKFTMDEDLSEAVTDVFIDLFNKGYIYRGVRMVNWDPSALTAISDEEVIHKEVNSKLYYVKYFVEGADEFIVVATTRPETILGDTAVCVHPDDERYTHLKGKKVIVPMVNRVVPIIFDEYVDKEFGTGALKITPAHDINDYNLGIKHNLATIDIFNDNGTLNEAAQLYVGEDRFAVRDKSVADMQQSGLIFKIEDYVNKVGFSERTDAVIEPKLSMQWFCDMGKMSTPALDNVMNDTIRFYPPKFKNTYKHWMENVKDWCISRQLWWGHRIPAYFYGVGANDYVVAKTEAEALALAKQRSGNAQLTLADLRQDEDVLDTWFSSWLWPISTFDGIRHPDNKDISYYYPTDVLVTAPDILFFWVARMIMSGYEYRGQLPFSSVYLTGMVRDKQGRKMSKSLGNSPDPLDLIDAFGADAVRVGMLLGSNAGNDVLYDDSQCEQGRNFCNKLWNAFRLVSGWTVDTSLEQPEYAAISVTWFDARIKESVALIDDHFSKFRLSDALMTAYKLVWDDFCSWYLEMIKPGYQQPIDKATYDATIAYFEQLLLLLHPFMPFITEEIWHVISERTKDQAIIISAQPAVQPFDQQIISEFEFAQEVIENIRRIRKEKNIAQKEPLELKIRSKEAAGGDKTFASVISKLANISDIAYIQDDISGALSFIIKTAEFFIPISADNIDIEQELQKLHEEIKYTQGFLQSVERKLSNEKFVNNAAAQVVEAERKKQADAIARIKVLQEQINALN